MQFYMHGYPDGNRLMALRQTDGLRHRIDLSRSTLSRAPGRKTPVCWGLAKVWWFMRFRTVPGGRSVFPETMEKRGKQLTGLLYPSRSSRWLLRHRRPFGWWEGRKQAEAVDCCFTGLTCRMRM